MPQNLKVLQHHKILHSAKLNSRDNKRRKTSSLTDPAIDVMTDFAQTIPLSVSASAPIDNTNRRMITYGVRLLFVNDANHNLVGLITATDILGEKPMQFITENGGKHEDIVAGDIMTAIEDVNALYMSDVDSANIGDIVSTIKSMQRQHLLVVEPIANEETESIRGIFSTSRIAQQLGINIEITDQANSFTEFVKAWNADHT